jgi:hypothetical protein
LDGLTAASYSNVIVLADNKEVNMQVHAEDHKGLRIAVYRMEDRFVCVIYTGAFGYHIVDHFTADSGLPPAKLFKTDDEAIAHAKAQIDTDKLRP